jgi:hypothetical protein
LGHQRVLVRPKNPEDISEQDMEIQNSNGSFVEKIFARYPLLGSYMISSKNLEILDQSVKNIIESVLKEPKLKLSLLAEMKIMLLIVNYAKDWNNEETGEFWKYILSRLGYRDKSGKILLILQSSVERSMKMNSRLFIEDETGRGFKSTVVVHALATKKSWMYLFDFLFDFYKENLNWKYMSGDPLLTEMVRSLQQKLKGIQEDDSLSISSTVYSFQEGIRKLILMRPVFTVDLFDRLLSKIDSLINSEEKPVKTYEEQLCEEFGAVWREGIRRGCRRGYRGHRLCLCKEDDLYVRRGIRQDSGRRKPV